MDSGLDHFALILPNNPQYQLGGKLAMDLIVGQQISLYFLRKATYNLKFGVYSL